MQNHPQPSDSTSTILKEDEPKYYLTPSFREHILKEYQIKDTSVLENSRVLKMLYCIEWGNIPRFDYPNLIRYHPQATNTHIKMVDDAVINYKIELGILFALLGLIANNRIRDKLVPLIKSKIPHLLFSNYLGRWGISCLIGGAITFGANYFVLYPSLAKKLERGELGQFLTLDLDIDLMKKDLEEIGVVAFREASLD